MKSKSKQAGPPLVTPSYTLEEARAVMHALQEAPMPARLSVPAINKTQLALQAVLTVAQKQEPAK